MKPIYEVCKTSISSLYEILSRLSQDPIALFKIDNASLLFIKRMRNWSSQASSGLSHTQGFKSKKAPEAVQLFIFQLGEHSFVKHIVISVGNHTIGRMEPLFQFKP